MAADERFLLLAWLIRNMFPVMHPPRIFHPLSGEELREDTDFLEMDFPHPLSKCGTDSWMEWIVIGLALLASFPRDSFSLPWKKHYFPASIKWLWALLYSQLSCFYS